MKYQIFLEREVHQARERLPGNFRQRLRAAITSLGTDPRPTGSQMLDVSALGVPRAVEVRRLRIDPWRLVYAISEVEGWLWLLALRRRPPYEYDDLAELLRRVERR